MNRSSGIGLTVFGIVLMTVGAAMRFDASLRKAPAGRVAAVVKTQGR